MKTASSNSEYTAQVNGLTPDGSDGMGDVLHHAQGAIAQIAADGPGLELVGRGGGAGGGGRGKVKPGDPKLMAGYPAVKNVAPNSATLVFSTNNRAI